MKIKVKKLAVVLAAMAMTLAMSVSAFAANWGNAALVTTDTALNIAKTLTVTNPTLSSVAGPGVTYSYAIASVTPSASNGGTSITDSGSHVGTVHPGPADGVTLTTASVGWATNEAVNASSSGAANSKNITASVDLSEFSAPGIYRYSITETASNLAAAGVVDTGANAVRYLDVYIERDAQDALTVKGYVLHDGATADGAPSNKIGFSTASFETVNVTLSNSVQGAMGDRQNQFGFAGTVSDNNRYFYANKAAAPTATDAMKNTTGSITTTLAHGETYYIAGLSTVATVAYTETNNTQDTYSVTYTGGEASDVAPSQTKAMAATSVGSAAAITFTNTLESVSPTGVVLRYGAALLVLAAAIAMFVLNRKAKASTK